MRWGGSSFGQFTVKSAYLRDTPSVLEYQDKIWRAFWQIKVPQRCMVFLCMVFRGRIITNELRASFDLTSNSYCSLCNEGVESTLHVLRDCKSAREVGDAIIDPNACCCFYQAPSLDWIKENISISLHDGVSEAWDRRFGAALWWLWK